MGRSTDQHWRLRKKSNFCIALHPSSLRRTNRTPHSSGLARLEFEAFYFAAQFGLFTGPSTFVMDPKSGIPQSGLHENINDYNSKVKVFHSAFKCVDRGAMLALSDL
jgi:hypothetical protein